VVLVDESVEAVASSDWAGRRLAGWVGRLKCESTMWTLVVVELEVFEQHAAEVAFARDQEPVEAFAAVRLDEALRVGVGDGSADRGADHADDCRRADLIEDSGELALAIANQDPESVQHSVDREVAGLLGDPWAGWIARDAGKVDAARLDLDEEQHVHAAQ
jgi:hypothetical protein